MYMNVYIVIFLKKGISYNFRNMFIFYFIYSKPIFTTDESQLGVKLLNYNNIKPPKTIKYYCLNIEYKVVELGENGSCLFW